MNVLRCAYIAYSLEHQRPATAWHSRLAGQAHFDLIPYIPYVGCNIYYIYVFCICKIANNISDYMGCAWNNGTAIATTRHFFFFLWTVVRCEAKAEKRAIIHLCFAVCGVCIAFGMQRGFRFRRIKYYISKIFLFYSSRIIIVRFLCLRCVSGFVVVVVVNTGLVWHSFAGWKWNWACLLLFFLLLLNI